jgi:hypothetical protein
VQRHTENRLVENGGRFDCFDDGACGNGPQTNGLVEGRCEHDVILATNRRDGPWTKISDVMAIRAAAQAETEGFIQAAPVWPE